MIISISECVSSNVILVKWEKPKRISSIEQDTNYGKCRISIDFPPKWKKKIDKEREREREKTSGNNYQYHHHQRKHFSTRKHTDTDRKA